MEEDSSSKLPKQHTEVGGIAARQGFEYQDHVAAGVCIGMIADQNISEVWCETFDDIAVFSIDSLGQKRCEFIQSKSERRSSLWSIAAISDRGASEGRSLIEKSLNNAGGSIQYGFRIVTRSDVNSDLQVLTLPLKAQARDDAKIEKLFNEIKERLGDVRSPSGLDLRYWLKNLIFEVKGAEADIEAKNIVVLGKALYQLGYDCTNLEVESFYTDCLMPMLRQAAKSDGKVSLDEKHIKRDSLVDILKNWYATRTKPNILRSIPYLRNIHFSGREREIDEIGRLFYKRRGIVLLGAGGMGKTQIAAEYCHRHLDLYQLVWWVRADAEITIESDLLRLAEAINVSVPNDSTASVNSCIRWLESHSDWLLVFDDFADLNCLARYIPAGSGGKILVTSQDDRFGEYFEPLNIGILSFESSRQYLIQRTKRNDSEPGLEEVLTRLDGLPLALAQAAGYINATSMRFTEYVSRFDSAADKLLTGPSLKPMYGKTVATTWQLSMQRVTEENPFATDVFKILSYFGSSEILRSLIYATDEKQNSIKDPIELDEALGLLSRYSLIELEPDSLRVHGLVQLVVRASLSEAEKKECVREALFLIALFLRKHQVEYLHISHEAEDVVPHAINVLRYSDQAKEHMVIVTEVQAAIGGYLTARGRFKEAESYLRFVLKTAKEANDAALPAALNNLAVCLSRSGKFAEAGELLEMALLNEEEHYGKYSPKLFGSLDHLSKNEARKGNHGGAIAYAQRAMDVLIASEDVNPIDYAEALHSLGSLLQVLPDRMQDAEKLLVEALAKRESLLGEDHISVAASLCNIAELYFKQSKYETSLRLQKRALKIMEKHYGIQHPDYATTRFNMGKNFYALAKHSEAERCMLDAIGIVRREQGDDNFLLAGFYLDLGTVYLAIGQHEKAEGIIELGGGLVSKIHGDDTWPKFSWDYMSLQIALVRKQYLLAYAKCSLCLLNGERLVGKTHVLYKDCLEMMIKIVQAIGNKEEEISYRKQWAEIDRLRKRNG